jgi:uncharacterized protein
MPEIAAHDPNALFQLVVLGSGPVGKTSLINALLGRTMGETAATMGTTRTGQSHTHVIDGLEGTLLLTDTPGLGGAGANGLQRELEAVELATRADLVIFLVDHDLARADAQTIFELVRQGKRLIVTLNKKDRFTDEDRGSVMTRLRERLTGVVPAQDIVAVAAAPAPFLVRTQRPDGRSEIVMEQDPPDLNDLESRVAEVVEREGGTLRAGNLLLRARLREQAEQLAIARERRIDVNAIIVRHQWVAAVTAFANPVLAFGPMAVGAVQLRMLSEMAAAYDVQLSPKFVEMVGRQMAQTLLKLGLAEAAAGTLAGFFKFNPLGFAAGGLIQAVTMGYLTRLIGDTFQEYLERGQSWGEGGMQGMLSRQLQENDRSKWLTEFAKMVFDRLIRR